MGAPSSLATMAVASDKFPALGAKACGKLVKQFDIWYVCVSVIWGGDTALIGFAVYSDG